jgi:hypothetical protein
MPDLGLVNVSSDDLRKLLRAVFRKQVDCPLTPAGLAATGLQDASGPLLAHLRGLDGKAVHAVVVAALAEREATDEPRARRPSDAQGVRAGPAAEVAVRGDARNRS